MKARLSGPLADGQDAGRMLLEIEGRIGELTAEMRDSSKRTSSKYREVAGEYDSAQRKRVQGSQLIKDNPAAVAAVIREAEENEDIPTKTAVLNRIQADKLREVSPGMIVAPPATIIVVIPPRARGETRQDGVVPPHPDGSVLPRARSEPR